MIDSTHVQAHRSAAERGEQKQAVGRSRGGRNTKYTHSLMLRGAFSPSLLTGGEAHDCPLPERLIRRVKPPRRMLGDKAYNSAELLEELHERGTKPVIPNRCNRRRPFGFSKRLYKLRWRIESAFNRLKDFRRIATRYDRLAQLPGLCLSRCRTCIADFKESGPRPDIGARLRKMHRRQPLAGNSYQQGFVTLHEI